VEHDVDADVHANSSGDASKADASDVSIDRADEGVAEAELTWEQLFDAARATQPRIVNAHTWRRNFGTASGAVLLSCDDGNHYVIKGRQSQRQIVNDQIVGRLGEAISAPVGEVCHVDVPAELIQRNQTTMGHMAEGLAHGSLYVPDCEDSRALLYHDMPENRKRYALMAVLYGWTFANDHQYSYSTVDKLVYSFDHGHFLGGPGWTGSALAAAPPALPDPAIVATCSLTAEEIRQARDVLVIVTRQTIAAAIASVPDGWGGLTIQERVSLAESLQARCSALRT
jgi:hypothetical protein